jgi:hypothetical protein
MFGQLKRFSLHSALTVLLRVSSYFFAAGIVLPALSLVCFAQTAETAQNRAAVFADRFLSPEARGREVLGYVHFGADYHGHEYLRTVGVHDSQGRPIPEEFALVYRFHWEDDGITDIAFLCDERGYVQRVQIMYTNAVWSQPFTFANGAIKLIGKMVFEANKNKMTPLERELVQKLIDAADAKGLLEWSLRFEQ